MSKADRSDWAAQVPWGGIQDKPALVDALSSLNASEVASLIEIISSLPDNASFSRVALTGKYSDLIGSPMFGALAFMSVASLESFLFGTENEIEVAFTGGRFVFSISDELILNGKSVTGGVYISGIQTLSGPGAINLTEQTTSFTSTGSGNALTLANGTRGQLKRIIHTVDGGSGVLTPTSALGFATITFSNAGDTATLQYTTSGWVIISLWGAISA